MVLATCLSFLSALVKPIEYRAFTGSNVLYDYTGNSSGYTYSADVYDTGYWYHYTMGDDLQVTTYSDIGVVMTFSLDDEFLYYPCRSFTFTSSFTQSATDFVVNEIILTGHNANGSSKDFSLTNLCILDDLSKSGVQGTCRFTFNAVDVGDYCHDVELYIDLGFYNERDDSFYLRSQDWHSWNSGGSGSDISVDDINSGFSSITDSLSGLPKLIAEAIESFFDMLGDIFSSGISALPSNIKTALFSSFSNLQSAINSLPTKLKSYFDSLGTIFSGGFIDLETAFEDGLSGVPANIAQQISSFFDSVVSAVNGLPAKLKSYFDSLGTIFSGGFIDLETVFDDGLLSVPGNIAEQLKGFFDDVVSAVDSVAQSVASVFVPSDDYLSDFYTKIDNLLRDKFGVLYECVGLVRSFFTDIFGGEVAESKTIYVPQTSFDLMGVPFVFGGWTVSLVPVAFEDFLEVVKLGIDIVCTLLFLNTLSSKYRSIFAG